MRFVLLLALCLTATAGCDSVDPNTPETAVATEANLRPGEDCRMSTGVQGNRYYRMVNGSEYEISYYAYDELCNR